MPIKIVDGKVVETRDVVTSIETLQLKVVRARLRREKVRAGVLDLKKLDQELSDYEAELQAKLAELDLPPVVNPLPVINPGVTLAPDPLSGFLDRQGRPNLSKILNRPGAPGKP